MQKCLVESAGNWDGRTVAAWNDYVRQFFTCKFNVNPIEPPCHILNKY